MQAGSLIFLLTPLREGRRKRPTQNPYPSRFLLTPLREGRRVPDRLLVALDSISTHAPAGGATCPRRRGLHILDISTHAPAGGATIVMLERYEYDGISTHAPAGGATIRAESAENAAEFLLTPLREGRRADAVVKGTALIISTHAPAGGATRRGRFRCRLSGYFYSRPCGRGDAATAARREWENIFLLTPLREGRQ